MTNVSAERLAKLREEALTKLKVVWDPELPEIVIQFDGTNIAMIRSLAFGSPADCFGGEMGYVPAPPDWHDEKRFALYSWDNDTEEGEWTGNMSGGDPLWESSISYPPPDPDEEAVEGLKAIIADLNE